ncbi:hypothetical protein AOA61_20250 [Pseudomonas sp. 2995-1]|nr:hypothetical protein AOA61_20250 [Pseudomonas sp. 2995-1]
MWNSIIRKKYESAIQLAKKQRKQLKLKDIETEELNEDYSKSVTQIEEKNHTKNPLLGTIDEMVDWLLEKKKEISDKSNSGINEATTEELQGLMEKNAALESELSKLKQEYEIVKNDYQLMINVMERATKRNENSLSSSK